MNTILKQSKQILVTAMLMLLIMPVIAQVKRPPIVLKKHLQLSDQLKEFYHLAAQASVTFVYPKGFKEILAPNDEDFSYDYALELPGKEFEIWFQIKSVKENWASYTPNQNNQNPQSDNPDSAYIASSKATASTFAGDNKSFERSIPPDVLVRYNADEGKSYLITLVDRPETKHYKYALLITLQKNHTGTILAVCFGNEKGPEFFKNIKKASNCLKFKS